ncbi:ABC transporter substrate-binding protein [Herbiconiux sp. YIM B11900]|uniref:ABC transporter substrate-binding protein n=1 Tax=Herbiconiux sp. YIM B11900 TaxID=3404131 RepID=UPI003F83015F
MMKKRHLATGVALAATAGLLAACSSGASSTESTDGAGDGGLTHVTFALDWTPNTNHTGLYTAIEKGYFEEAGLDVEILPYNGSYPETLIDAGAADFGIGFQDVSTFSMAAGADVQAIMAPLQHWATAIGVRADADEIKSPKDLDGLTYAGFGSVAEVPTLSTVIKDDGGTGEFENVTLGTSAYEALYSGDVDFVIPFVTWEGIEAELQGTPMKYFKYTDYGFPDDYALLVLGNKTWMGENPEVTKAFTQALAKGYEDAIADPDGTAQILIDANPDVLTEPKLVTKSQEMLSSDYMLDENGDFGLMTEERWAALGEFYLDAGILADENGTTLTEAPDWSTFFTNEYLSD